MTRRPWNRQDRIVVRLPRDTPNATADDPRAPLAVGDQISAALPGYTITLARTAECYRVTVLDYRGQVAEPAWCRNFTNDETAARAFARAAVLAFRTAGAALTTTIRRAS